MILYHLKSLKLNDFLKKQYDYPKLLFDVIWGMLMFVKLMLLLNLMDLSLTWNMFKCYNQENEVSHSML